MSKLPATLSAALLLALADPAAAAQIDYQIDLAVLNSNNIALSNTDTQDDTVLSPQLRFDVSQAGSALRLKARGEYQYLSYLDNTFDDESRGEFAGQLEWELAPQRVHWVMEDYLSSQPTDVFTAFTPGNRQQINVFNAGPRFFARFGEAMRAQGELRYSNTWAETTKEFNGDRYNVAARLLRDLGPSRHVGLNAEATQVRFDRPQSVDYERYDTFVTYSEQRERLVLGFDLGYSQLDRDGGLPDRSAPLARARMELHVGSRSTLSGDVDYEFADAARDVVSRANLTEGPIIGALTNAEVLANAETYRHTRIALGYRFRGERLSVYTSPYYQRINYQDAITPDQTSRGGFANAELRLQPSLSLGAQVAYERRHFDTSFRRDRDLTLQLALTKTLTSHWSTRLGLQRRERNSSDPLQSYNENLVSLTVSYRR